MRNGAYAGPVTLGKHDVTVNEAPSSRSRAMAGALACVKLSPSAAFSVSGRTPSAIMMITGNSTFETKTTVHWTRRLAIANELNAKHGPLAGECPPASDRLVRHRRLPTLRSFAMSDQHLNAIQE